MKKSVALTIMFAFALGFSSCREQESEQTIILNNCRNLWATTSYTSFGRMGQKSEWDKEQWASQLTYILAYEMSVKKYGVDIDMKLSLDLARQAYRLGYIDDVNLNDPFGFKRNPKQFREMFGTGNEDMFYTDKQYDEFCKWFVQEVKKEFAK